MRRFTGIARVAEIILPVVLVAWGAVAAAKSPLPKMEVLSDNDVGVAGDMTTPGRWGKPEKDDGRTCRSYSGPKMLSYVGIKPWFDAGELPPADVMIVVTLKDTTSQAVTVLAWNGEGRTYGHSRIGQVGGTNDGRWKQVVLFCPRKLIRRHVSRERGYKGNCSLMFTGGGKILLDRIQVAKVSKALKGYAISQALAARAASVEALRKSFQHVPRKKDDVKLGEVSGRDRRLGFVPYVRNYALDVYPDSIPRREELGLKPLRTYAVRGEFEPLQAAAYALKDVTITASVSDLIGPGRLRAGKDVVIHRVEAAPLRVGSSWGKRYRVMPVWLRPSAPQPVKAGTSQAWYITVRVPPSAKPGTYKGAFTLSAAAGKAEFSVELRVLPFTLDKADHLARGPYVAGIIADELIRDLADHGMNSMSMFRPAGPIPALEGGKCVAKVSPRMNEYFKKLKAAGIKRMVLFGGGDPHYQDPSRVRSVTGAAVGTEKFEKYYAQFWQDIRRQEKANGWPEFICCPFDEPVKSRAKTANYLTCYNIIRKAVPDMKVFCVFMNKPWAANRLGLQADIWSCNGAFAQAQAEKARLAKQGVRKLFYTYTGAMGSTRPGGARYNAGVLPWRYGADGTYFWAYLWFGGDPFNDLDAGHRDWSPVARDVDGKLYGSVGWEGYREGVDDQRYIQTCIRMAKAKGRKDILAKIAKLKLAVRKGQESDESRRTHGLDDFFIKIDNASILDVYRARVVAMILDMLGVKE